MRILQTIRLRPWKKSNQENLHSLYETTNELNTAFIHDTGDFEYGSVQDLDSTISVERDLGILLENKLSWSQQIESCIYKAIIYKANKSLGLLRRAFKHWTPYTFRILFTTFSWSSPGILRPYLEPIRCCNHRSTWVCLNIVNWTEPILPRQLTHQTPTASRTSTTNYKLFYFFLIYYLLLFMVFFLFMK